MNITRLNTSYGDDVVRVGTSGGNAPAAELAVKTTYNNLVALRDSGRLVAGQMYRITDYETTCTWENTQVAGHLFDIITVALDNKTLDEKCSAIQSERDTDGYFANSNLAAWDVRYCLDNDVNRFDWAQMGGRFLIAEDEWENYAGVLDGTIVINGVTYYKWVCTNGWAILCTASKNPSAGEEIIVTEIGFEDDYWNGVAIRIEDREDGKGVVYRLIDEYGNSVPYDFKNIMFSRPLTEGKYDVENGVDTFCYTFSCIDLYTFEIADHSVKNPLSCTGNVFGLYSMDNVALTFDGQGCFSNTFGDACYNNTLGNFCYNNTFGNECSRNTLGERCQFNTFGNSCESNTFGKYCYENTFGNKCDSNTFGDGCHSNTFGDSCSSNTFGRYCTFNTFMGNCYNIIFGESKDKPHDYYRFNIFDGDNHEINFRDSNNGAGAGSNGQVQYYHFTIGAREIALSSNDISAMRNSYETIFVRAGYDTKSKQVKLSDLL